MNFRILLQFSLLCGLPVACQTTTESITPTAPPPAGYADGTKEVGTANLEFTSLLNGVTVDSNTEIVSTGLAELLIRTTENPGILIVTLGGQEISLTIDPATSVFVGGDASLVASLKPLKTSDSQQVSLFALAVTSPNFASLDIGTFGLETDPSEISVKSGIATYNGDAFYASEAGLFHHSSAKTYARGTVTLRANFDSAVVSGSMFLTDDGSDPGHEISPTTIGINATGMSGNSFATDLTLNGLDLGISTVITTSLNGTFYGVDGSDVAGSFSGAAVGGFQGTSPVEFFGGFIAD